MKLLNLEGYGRNLVLTNLWAGLAFIALLILLVGWLGPAGAALAVLLFIILSNALFYRSTMQYTGPRLAPFVHAYPRNAGG